MCDSHLDWLRVIDRDRGGREGEESLGMDEIGWGGEGRQMGMGVLEGISCLLPLR